MSPIRPTLALLVALACCGAAGSVRADEACRLRRVASVEAFVADGRPLQVAATVAGIGTRLVVATGVRYSLLSHAFARRAALPIEDVHAPPYGAQTQDVTAIFFLNAKINDAFGASDGQFSERTRVPQLRLGTARSDDETFVVSPSGGDGTDGGPVGVFGADYLSSYEVEIDPAAGRLNLYDHDHCPGRVVAWSAAYGAVPLHLDLESRRISARVELDGIPLDAEIDTGEAGTTLSLAAASRSFGLGAGSDRLVPAEPVAGLDGRHLASWSARFRTLTLGGVIVHDPQIAVTDFRDGQPPPTGSHLPADAPPGLRIGMNVLKALHLVIAYGEDKLYYTPARSAPL